MKAKSSQIKALKSQLSSAFDAVVLYGTDEAEIQYTFTTLKQLLNISSDDFTCVHITKEALKKTPFIATDEANTTSLIATRRFLFINEDVDFEAKSLIHFLQNKKTNALLIIKAGNLTKSNALRVEAEKNPRVLALACYPPKIQDIQKMIYDYLYEQGKTISPKNLHVLCSKISSNQQLILQELDKLLVYLGDQKEVDLPSIQACFADNFDASFDDFCINLADGNTEAVSHFLTVFDNQDISLSSLLWAVRDYFERLLLIQSENSLPLIQAIKQHLAPAQFRLETPLTHQVRFWNKEAIFQVLKKLSELEVKTRQTGYSFNALILQCFLSICQQASKLSRLR